MNDLFGNLTSTGHGFLDLPGADVRLIPAFLDMAAADSLFRSLINETPWEERRVFVWGRWRVQPRLVAWYGDPEARYSYSGDTLDPTPWTPPLAALRARVEAVAGARFNSVLLNLYRDEKDRMGWHNDDEPELGQRPVIASVSLGETRTFLLKPREKRRAGLYRVSLDHGSLLVMAGDTQRNWVHAVNSESTPCGPRINLTFRLVQPAAVRRTASAASLEPAASSGSHHPESQ